MRARRLSVLRAATVQYPGPWRPGMVGRLYAARGIRAPKRRTHRGDLARLAREGLLTEHGPDHDRTYTLNLWKAGAQ